MEETIIEDERHQKMFIDRKQMEEGKLLDWPNGLFEFLCKMLLKNPNKNFWPV